MGLKETVNGQKNVELFFNLLEKDGQLKEEVVSLFGYKHKDLLSYQVIGGAGKPDAVFKVDDEEKILELKKISSAVNSIKSMSYLNPLISNLDNFNEVKDNFSLWLRERSIPFKDGLIEFFNTNFDSLFDVIFDSDLYSFTDFEKQKIYLISKNVFKQYFTKNMNIALNAKGTSFRFDKQGFLNIKKKGGGSGPETLVFYLSFNKDVMAFFESNKEISKISFN